MPSLVDTAERPAFFFFFNKRNGTGMDLGERYARESGKGKLKLECNERKIK